MNDNLMRVQPIRNGTVIDHIKAGRGRKVLDALELIDKGTTITLLMHVPSKKNSSKDVIKIEDRELAVYHDESDQDILDSLDSLALDTELVKTDETDEKVESDAKLQSKLLW